MKAIKLSMVILFAAALSAPAFADGSSASCNGAARDLSKNVKPDKMKQRVSALLDLRKIKQNEGYVRGKSVKE